MAALLPFISAVSGVVGIATGIKSLIGGGKKAEAAPAPAPPPLPEKPKAEDAAKKAEESVARRRKISVLSGGVTNITGGKALVSESNLGRKQLLGA